MQWARIRELPVDEQAPFARWIRDQTRPLIDDVPDDEQDAYYRHDYELWKEQDMPLEQRFETWD